MTVFIDSFWLMLRIDRHLSAEDLPVVKPYCDKCGRNNPERWLPRLPYNMLFVVGGWSMGQPLSAIEAFDPCADRWVHHKNESIFEPRAYHAVAVYKRRIFVVGGMQERNYLRSTISYDMDKCEWKNESSMNVPRAYVASVTLGEFVYAIGGHTGVERTPSVERYSPRTSQWTVVCRMNRRRSDAAACAIKGRLLVCGGFNGRHCLESIEEYIPQTDTWSLIHSLPFARCSHRMIVLGAYVYVIGGFDGRRRLTSDDVATGGPDTMTATELRKQVPRLESVERMMAAKRKHSLAVYIKQKKNSAKNSMTIQQAAT
ncbi:kelch-like protein 10 isoform X2 [Dermacentor silvarum]|uniref:kelch-like protein 10 isoform X2 n=1 Tax=Dermacentor silvarum TaxID=543639 RepID=UPI002101D454|nr:kelch-like protein 10 isoform X2 [Dermacentor silvarum]